MSRGTEACLPKPWGCVQVPQVRGSIGCRRQLWEETDGHIDGVCQVVEEGGSPASGRYQGFVWPSSWVIRSLRQAGAMADGQHLDLGSCIPCLWELWGRACDISREWKVAPKQGRGAHRQISSVTQETVTLDLELQVEYASNHASKSHISTIFLVAPCRTIKPTLGGMKERILDHDRRSIVKELSQTDSPAAGRRRGTIEIYNTQKIGPTTSFSKNTSPCKPQAEIYELLPTPVLEG